MDQQKVVMILLLITIILSIFSVVLTVSINPQTKTVNYKETITQGSDPKGDIVFGITPVDKRGTG